MQKIIDEFLKPYNECKIAIYGTGLNAERVVTSVHGYNFVSIISNDENMIGKDFHGLRIYRLDDALKNVEIILIAAIPSATRIVYERIKDQVPSSIKIFDLSGRQLNSPLLYQSCDYWNVRYDDLIDEIDRHDIISFDIFDTLLIRKTLYPETVLKLLAEEYMGNFTHMPLFFQQRRDAEFAFYKENKHPTISDIYRRIFDNTTSDTSTWLSGEEVKYEQLYTGRREDVVRAYKYALSKNKKIYLVSDMYLSGTDIRSLLDINGITEYDGLIVSCEEGCSKGSGELFKVLRSKAGSGKILHIGNDEGSDVNGARLGGVDSFHIYSGLDIILNSSVAYVIGNVNGKYDELLLGTILSEINVFNSPFEMGKTKGKLYFDSVEMMAEICFLPITMAYVSWIINQVKDKPKDVILFVSRDGFFLEKIYRRIREENPQLNLPKSNYFYSSRKVMLESVSKDHKDIDVLCSNLDQYRKTDIVTHIEKIFGISLKEQLSEFCGKRFDEIDMDELMKALHSISDIIFAHAEECRSRYIKYIDSLELDKYNNIFMVDLVAQGSSRYGLENIIGRPVKLLALGTTSLPNAFIPDPTYATSMYGELVTGVGNAVSKMFNLLELIYASADGQLVGFTEKGSPLFDASTQYNSELLERVQNKISECISSYLDKNWYANGFSKEFAVSMFGILSPECSDIAEEVNWLFDFYDPLDEKEPNHNVMNVVRGV